MLKSTDRAKQMAKLRSLKRRSDLKASQLYFYPDNPTTELEASRLSSSPRHAKKHGHDTKLLKATIQISELLTADPNTLTLKQLGVVRRLVGFLTMVDSPQLQCEAAWALANIAAERSEGTAVVIDSRAVPILVGLLRCSPNADVCEQAVFALGVLAGRSPTIRDHVLGHGALELLLKELKKNPNLSMLRNATWALSNLCGGTPRPSFEQVEPSLETLNSLLCSDDWEVLTDSCLALSYLSESIDNIDKVIRAGVCPGLVKLLDHVSTSVVISALQAISNIVSVDDTQTQAILDNGALGNLLKLLSYSDNKRFRKEICFVLSNITAGDMDQIQAVIDARLIEPLVELLPTAEFDTRQYAALAISNVVAGGSCTQIGYLVSKGCLKALCDLVRFPDNPKALVYIGLDGLCYIIDKGENNIDCKAMIRDLVGLDRIYDLASDHEDKQIVLKASDVLRRIM